MGQWVETEDHFTEADVLRWKEAVFQARRRNEKLVEIGERLVVAEVLREDSDWVYLLVRHCELASTITGRLPRQVPLLHIGQATKRKASVDFARKAGTSVVERRKRTLRHRQQVSRQAR